MKPLIGAPPIFCEYCGKRLTKNERTKDGGEPKFNRFTGKKTIIYITIYVCPDWTWGSRHLSKHSKFVYHETRR